MILLDGKEIPGIEMPRNKVDENMDIASGRINKPRAETGARISKEIAMVVRKVTYQLDSLQICPKQMILQLTIPGAVDQ